MTTRDERIEERARQIRAEEGASQGRAPDGLDPESAQDAETVRANKAMAAVARGDAGRDDDPLALRPGKGQLPPPD